MPLGRPDGCAALMVFGSCCDAGACGQTPPVARLRHFLLTGPRECLNVQRGLALSWSWSPPFLVLSLHLGVSLGPIDYGEDPGILSAGAFSCLLARRGYPPFQKRCDFWRWSVRSVVRQERVGAACCVWFAGALQLPGRVRGVLGGPVDRAHTVRRRDAFAVARGSVSAVMAARLDCRTDSALTIKTCDRNVCAGMWGPGAVADCAPVWGVAWSGRRMERGSVGSSPKMGEQRRKRVRARRVNVVVWQISREDCAWARARLGLASPWSMWVCFVHGVRSLTRCASVQTDYCCGA